VSGGPLTPDSEQFRSAPRTYSPDAPHGWAAYPNLLLVPRAPAAGRGRLQRQIRRAFMVHGPELSASTIYDWCKSWPQTLDGRHLGRAHRWSIVRILETVAHRVGRSRGRDRPWIWRLRKAPADAGFSAAGTSAAFGGQGMTSSHWRVEPPWQTRQKLHNHDNPCA
jgi:hypothetical protein